MDGRPVRKIRRVSNLTNSTRTPLLVRASRLSIAFDNEVGHTTLVVAMPLKVEFGLLQYTMYQMRKNTELYY